MAYSIKQSTTESALVFLLVLTSDHLTGATGKSPTVTLSKNGGAFGSAAGSVTEISSGWYKVAANATDTNTLGPLALHATAASCDPTDLVVAEIVAYDPQDGGTVADIAAAVWDEAQSGHTTAGTAGANLTNINTISNKLGFDASNNVKADVKAVNDLAVGGAGTSGSPWGPA